LNGVVSVPLLFLVIRIATNHKVMGRWRSSRLAGAWSWIAFVLMAAAAVAMFTV
jgi:Mn2+/Fe2+ NRAMP family transporter